MNNRLLRIILIITPITIVIAAAALLFVIILILNPDWELTRNFIYIREIVTATSMAAMVVATLFLAWATFSVINNDRQREERDRKERLLNEIFEWAEDAAESAISRRTRTPDELWKTKLKYKYSRAKSKYIIEVTSLSFKNLSSLVKSVIVKLDQVIHATTQVINHQDPAKELVDCENELTESIEALIIEIAKIKTKDSID